MQEEYQRKKVKNLTPKRLEQAVRNSWGRDTSYYKYLWDDDTQSESAGQCRVVSLIVQDYFGGKLHFSRVIGNPRYTHFWNELPDGKQVDLTRDQFPKEMKLMKSVIISRNETLDNKRIQRTYKILKRKVAKYIKDNY